MWLTNFPLTLSEDRKKKNKHTKMITQNLRLEDKRTLKKSDFDYFKCIKKQEGIQSLCKLFFLKTIAVDLVILKQLIMFAHQMKHNDYQIDADISIKLFRFQS
jgi:hypothetical protein